VPTALGHRRSNDLVLFSLGGLGESFFVLVFFSFAGRYWRPTAREKPIALGLQTAPNGQSSQSGSPERVMLTRIVPSEWSRDKERHGTLNGRIAYTSSTVDGLGIFSPSSTIPAIYKLKASAALRRASSKVLPARNAPGNLGSSRQNPIYDPYADMRCIHQSPQPNACLLFDASQRANRYISNRMCHSDPSGFTGCLNCLWLPTCATSIPAVLLQALYSFSAGHNDTIHTF